MIITGQLSEYSLPVLVEILTRNGETGVLVLEHKEVSGSLHFINGKLSGVSVGELTGPEAIRFAETLDGATFRFERLTLVQISQKLWSETMEEPRGGRLRGLWTKAQSAPRQLHRYLRKDAIGQQAHAESGRPGPPSVSSPQKSFHPWFWLAVVAAVIFMSIYGGLSQRHRAIATDRKGAAPPDSVATDSDVIRVPQNFGTIDVSKLETGEIGPTPQPTALVEEFGVEGVQEAEYRETRLPVEPPALVAEHTASPNRPEASTQSPQPAVAPNAHAGQTVTPSGPQTINVILRIESGRVTQASILLHRQGLDDYEAAALRTARQRRYPPSFSGQETVSVQVEQQR